MPRWISAVLLLLLAMGSVFAGVQIHREGKKVKMPTAPRVVTADELRKLQNPETLADRWVSFTFTKGMDTGLSFVSRRSRTVHSKCLLIEVKDALLIAEVKPGFSGKTVEGRLVVWDSLLYQKMTDQLNKIAIHNNRRLLPYQIDCQDEFTPPANDKIVGGGFLILLGGILGMTALYMMFTGGSGPAPAAKLRTVRPTMWG